MSECATINTSLMYLMKNDTIWVVNRTMITGVLEASVCVVQLLSDVCVRAFVCVDDAV